MSTPLKEQLYLCIKQKIEEKMPDVKTVRLFNDQFNNEKKEDAFLYHAIFIQFENIDYMATTGGSQQGDFLLTFHIGVESLKTEDLRIFGILDELFLLLTDLNIGFTRTREAQDINHDSVQVWQQSHKVNLTDDTGNIHDRRKTTANVNDLEIIKELSIDPLSTGGTRTDDEIQ